MSWPVQWVSLVFLVGAMLVRGLDNPIYYPCYPRPVEDIAHVGQSSSQVSFTLCGDQGVGNQSMWWRAVEPDAQCFGLGRPGRECSKSTTNEFHCLVGEKWDRLRLEVNFPASQRTAPVKIEVGNRYSMSLQGAVSRIILEELMNFPVELVVRTGTSGVYERVSRTENYLSMEVWKSSVYTPADLHYVRSEVLQQPFVKEDEGIAYTANRSKLIDWQPPDEDLENIILNIKESAILSKPLRSIGYSGIYLNGPGVQSTNGVEFWHVLQNKEVRKSFSQDGTIKCQERLRSGKSCTDPEATFFCDGSCPAAMWGGTACCYHGKFYPPQCIPAGVSAEDIMADPDWSSPYCSELIHPDASLDVGYFEAVIVNLGLNFTVNYLGDASWRELVLKRTLEGTSTLFYGFVPDALVEAVNASQVLLPEYTDACGRSYSTDPLESGIFCGKESIDLTKLISSKVKENNPDLYNFWNEFSLTNDEYRALLSLHVAGGGLLATIDQAACEWVKEAGAARWHSWVQNSNASSDSSNTRLMLALLISCTLVVVIVAAVLVSTRPVASSEIGARGW
eukprot:CAMPEP_0118926970 /NCGR_PEP_ID=MMETSP1169-20130426/4561_1 /TAXON_ID=36882 /ORGANISM="Pyramimonas obovata, Strain CCMP722" /LENGTH=563 /DNA_ID=CAMNT_0006868639 /DNA_START=3192 /DNA_END=4880 /DNA_ORIENTATION=+